MSPCCAHAEVPRAGAPPRPGKLLPRVGRFVSWTLPGIGLALVPKCPFCVAGYVALWTGLGISLSAAAHLRTGLIVVCATALVFAVLFQVKRHLARRIAPSRHARVTPPAPP